MELPAAKRIALVNKIIKVEQLIPIKNGQVKQFADRNDGMNSVMIASSIGDVQLV